MTDAPLWYGCAHCKMRTPKVQAAAAAYQPCPHCGWYAYLTDREYQYMFPIEPYIDRWVVVPLGPPEPQLDDGVDEEIADALRWPLERRKP